jgi:Flp pilus assembly protein TadD
MRHFKLVKAALFFSAVLPVAGCDDPPTARVPTVEAAPLVAARVDLGLHAAERPVTVLDPVAVAEVDAPPDDLVQQARVALEGNDVEGAYVLAKKAVLETPERWSAWNTLGRVQLRKGQNGAALDSFEEAVESNPSSAWARNNFGLTLLYDERYAEAVDQFEEATKLAPSNGLMWNNLGVAYEHVDRVEDARRAYRQAMGLDHKAATRNYVRIEGVRSHTAKIDTPVEPEGDTGL